MIYHIIYFDSWEVEHQMQDLWNVRTHLFYGIRATDYCLNDKRMKRTACAVTEDTLTLIQMWYKADRISLMTNDSFSKVQIMLMKSVFWHQLWQWSMLHGWCFKQEQSFRFSWTALHVLPLLPWRNPGYCPHLVSCWQNIITSFKLADFLTLCQQEEQKNF